ncbi:hypothetical protein HYFRA_00010713 [Hymenoscyphus fraxineus]|uniref:Zn(2)-C6 fungal-type domain-containing protein n=1 Tax=Hymenoscyphus fraxineus TaxID=746836 RepID=A0A9N9PVI3_9HELO|nr:hypothetical protein HYFRA_00010713 [Hymenoscyphus fraxineus]
MNVVRNKDQRPCDNCRRRKIRCLYASEDATNCVLCLSRSTECTFLQDAPRKKRPHTSNNINQDEGTVNQRRKTLSTGMRLNIVNTGIKTEKIAQDSRPVLRDYSDLKGKSLLKETLGHQNRESTSALGGTSDFDPAIIRNLSFNPQGKCLESMQDDMVLRRPSLDVHFLVRPDNQEEMDQELENLDIIERLVAPHGQELVNLYFRIVHPTFPILHKNVFLEKIGRSYRESTPSGLGAVYVMALDWWSYSPYLSTKPKPDAKELERVVTRMLFDVQQRPKISDLQGGLVLLQKPDVNSWAMTGHLLAMAQSLGIHLDCTDWQVPDWERGVRKRVAWALFLQDKWGALVYGRPSNIRMDSWDVRPLVVSDFPETSKDDDDEEGSAEIEKGRQTFVYMVSLTMIVSEILDQFFTLAAIRRRDNLPAVLERARPIQMRLKDWFSSLPQMLSVDDIKPRKLSSVGYLHLAYYTAEITLHRAILRSHSFPSPDSDLILMTRRTAGTRFSSALDFVQRLRQEHLQSFWHFSSSCSLAIIGVFAGILAITSTDPQERDSYISRLAEYRWILRVSNTGSSVMKYAVGVLDKTSQLLDQQIKKEGSRRESEIQESPALEVSPAYSGSVSVGVEDRGWGESSVIDPQHMGYSHDLKNFPMYDMASMANADFFTFDSGAGR